MREHAAHIRHDGALARLLDDWGERDERYVHSGVAMSPEQEAVVRAQRAREIERLPPYDRATAVRVLSRWSAPQPQRRHSPFVPAIRALGARS